jgi:hypothetical protein
MLVREYISFERGKDPKSALGIGIHYPRTFKSKKELVDYLLIAIPEIFDGEIPEDIVCRDEYIIGDVYFHMICDFLEEHKMTFLHNDGGKSNNWKYSDAKSVEWWPLELKKRLLELGFKDKK